MAATQSHPRTELAPTPWEEQLLTHFDEHVNNELDLIEEYLELRDHGPEYVRYLIDMILNDEARHHQIFEELVNRLRSDVDFRDYEPKVPYLTRKAAENKALIEATERFLTFERHDAKALHHLEKELRPVRDTTLFSLLVQIMELDTRKHIAILEFIRRTAKPLS
ncbi:MAG TPA: hypothetical protein VHL53_02300 [Acidimicrobiia bacterium]|nr:hypothetical protein [Acidimicrobiia bacterium]